MSATDTGCSCDSDRQILFAADDGRLLVVCQDCQRSQDVTPTMRAIAEEHRTRKRRTHWRHVGMAVGMAYGACLWLMCALMVAVTVVPMAALAGALLVLFLCGLGVGLFRAWVGRWRQIGARS